MKYIFVTGGVVSSLGKGLTVSAIGALLEQQGLSIAIQKFDPYLNFDSGTMNPLQHGEVFVLSDGAETDLDFGHYERFTNSVLTKKNSLTSGQVYKLVLDKERAGNYLGDTIQVIPHITNEIKNRIYENSKSNIDVLITEIGGTVGDIEGLPFLEAIRQFVLEQESKNILFIHITLIPYLQSAGEMKTKPSQQSVAKLRELGIQPNLLLCRTEKTISESIKDKLSLFCNINKKFVIEARDVKQSIYELPFNLKKEKLDKLIIESLKIKKTKKLIVAKKNTWNNIVKKLNIKNKPNINIGLVGKYIECKDSYKSIYESINHSAIELNCNVTITPINSEKLDFLNLKSEIFNNLNGVIIPGGFGYRGIEGMIQVSQYAREKLIPFFGICLGMQIAIIDFARNVANLTDANSTEFKKMLKYPVIDIMKEQNSYFNKGGTMRLGQHPCKIIKNTHTYKAYNKSLIYERHRHRYEFNNKFKSILVEKGLVISGINDQKNLIEIIEIKNHPWFIGTQFHPEFQSKPHKAHPLFNSFINASLKYNLINKNEK